MVILLISKVPGIEMECVCSGGNTQRTLTLCSARSEFRNTDLPRHQVKVKRPCSCPRYVLTASYCTRIRAMLWDYESCRRVASCHSYQLLREVGPVLSVQGSADVTARRPFLLSIDSPLLLYYTCVKAHRSFYRISFQYSISVQQTNFITVLCFHHEFLKTYPPLTIFLFHTTIKSKISRFSRLLKH